MVIGLLCAAGLIPYFWVPESPRWLILHGKKDEAVKVFETIAKTNGKELTDEQRKKMLSIIDEVEGEGPESNI